MVFWRAAERLSEIPTSAAKCAAERGTLIFVLFAFPWQAGGVFVCALAEAAAEAGGQSDAGFAELVAKLVGGGKSVLPFLLTVSIEQIDLCRSLALGRGSFAQPDAARCGSVSRKALPPIG